jgi:suppressor of tumorigenicity protein 13
MSVYDPAVDWDGAADAKSAAGEAKSAGNYAEAVDAYTRAMELGGASALTLANRAQCLLLARRPKAALSDCTEALSMNPDSAKALRW